MSNRITAQMRLASLVDQFDQRRYAALTVRILSRGGVTVRGCPLWVAADCYWDCAFPGAITIGDRCVISRGVRLLTHDFSLDRIAERKFGQTEREVVYRGPITIGDYAFIGMGVIVLPGVTIGRGAIVGSGAVVTKDVPDDVVVGGNPARTISTTDEFYERRNERFIWQDRRR